MTGFSPNSLHSTSEAHISYLFGRFAIPMANLFFHCFARLFPQVVYFFLVDAPPLHHFFRVFEFTLACFLLHPFCGPACQVLLRILLLLSPSSPSALVTPLITLHFTLFPLVFQLSILLNVICSSPLLTSSHCLVISSSSIQSITSLSSKSSSTCEQSQL